MINNTGKSKSETLKIIKALVEFSIMQNTPIENTLNEFMPYIIQSANVSVDQFHEFDMRIYKTESAIIAFQEYINKNTNKDQINDIDKRLSIVENIIKGLEDRLQLQAQRAFWANIGILIAILGGLAGICALALKLIGSSK